MAVLINKNMELTDKTIHQHYKGGLYVKVEEDVLHTETTEDDLVCYKSILTQKPYVRPRVLFDGLISTVSGQIFRFTPIFEMSYRDFLFYSTLEFSKEVSYECDLLELEASYKSMIRELGIFDKDTYNNFFSQAFKHGHTPGSKLKTILDKALIKEYPSIYQT